MDKRVDFKGKWISDSELAEIAPTDVYGVKDSVLSADGSPLENIHLLFRKTFEVSEADKAELYISADDFYKLYINGLPVTAGPAPGYPFHYYCNKIDVSDFLFAGENTIAVHTYYSGLINRVSVSGDGRTGLILDLYCNGKLALCSDETFRTARHTAYTATGKCGYETQFLERYDSNAPQVGFESPLFDDGNWSQARIKKNADYKIFLQPTKQVETEPIKAASVKKAGNTYTVDFGSVYAGYLFAAAKGKKGSVVHIRCGQELDGEKVRVKLRACCRYEEEWVLSGEEDYLDWFDYKAFRYAEIEMPDDAELYVNDLRLIARHYPFALKAKPNTDDPDLLKIWNLCVNTLKYGVCEIFPDCLEREKGQYLGDGIYTASALSVLTGDTAMLKEFVDNALQSGTIDKGLLSCSVCSHTQRIAEFSLMLPWIFVVYYKLTGDKAFLEENFDAVAGVLNCFRESYETKGDCLLYELDRWCVVDWPDGARDGYDFKLVSGPLVPGTHNEINAYYIGAYKAMNRLSDILGRGIFRDTADMEESYNRVFFKTDTHLYRDAPASEHSSLAANVYPLLFGIGNKNEFTENTVKMITEKGLKAVNIFTAFPMLAALKKLGRNDELTALLKDENGWLNMLAEGATVTAEAFGKDRMWNTSLFHITLSYAALFLTDWGFEDILNK